MITLTAKIYVSATETIEINQENMKSIKRNISDRESVDKPSWGIVSNRGEISFYDPYGQVLDLIESQKLDTSIKIEVFINNTLAKVQKSLGEFYSEKWKYDNNSRLVNVTIKDDLQEWQEIIISNEPLFKNFNYLDIYYWLRVHTPSKFNISVSEEVLEYLGKITETSDSLLFGSTLWSFWEQFCEATMLHIYKNDKGEVVISNHS